MRVRKFRLVLGILLVSAVLVGMFVFLAIAESKMEVEVVPPAPPQVVTDVVQYDLDLLKVTSNWPENLTVENISDKEISGFEILIFAANDDGGPGEFVRWGTNPNYNKQTPLFKARETMTLPIRPQAVKNFQDNELCVLCDSVVVISRIPITTELSMRRGAPPNMKMD